MRLGNAQDFLASKRTLWLVAGLIVILFAIGNLPWELDDYDQAKQAFTSFEMVKEGHWFYQRTPNEKVATKPPLVGWISAGLFAVSRSWDVAWRLPSFLTALAMLVLLYRIAKEACGAIAALVAMSAFGFNLLALRLATLVRTDMALALVVFLLGWQIWEKIRRVQPWTGQDRLLTFGLLTAAMLIKGPIVYAFLLPGIVLFQWRTRKNLSNAGAWCGWWPWLLSFGIFLVWVVGGILSVPGFFQEVVVKEFIGRFGETIHRPQAIYFYLPHLLHKFAPWSVLGIVLIILKMRAERTGIGKSWRNCAPGTFWLICWSLGGVLLMSLIPSKRVDRIFPVIAPFSLILAVLVGRSMLQEELRARALKWCAVALIFACFFSAGYVIIKVGTGYRESRGALITFGRAVCATAQQQGWRYEVIGKRDEGLLLYLQELHFSEPNDVIAKWNRHEIDAVVVPESDRAVMLRDLEGSVPSQIQSGKEKDVGRYILLIRS
jgi:4-amino-4-deoxy-L-arabinose transferase-like glycosyltransferase